MSAESDRVPPEHVRDAGDGINRRDLFGFAETLVSLAAAQTAAAAGSALAQSYGSEAVGKGNVPMFDSIASVARLAIPQGVVTFRTDGYASVADGGGGHYVETLTETDADPGVVADGSGPRRYFKLAERIINIRQFGARGDGLTDDRAAIQKAIDFATANRRHVIIPEGRFLVDSVLRRKPADAILITASDADLSIFCEGELVIGAGILDQYTSGGFIRIDTPSGDVLNPRMVRWRGGSIDARQLPYLGGFGIGALSVWNGRFDVEGLKIDAGTGTPEGNMLGSGGLDTGISGKSCKYLRVHGCQFIGCYDSGIYLSGDTDDNDTEDDPLHSGYGAILTENRFDRCGNAIALKRFVRDTIIGFNYVQEVGNGVLFGGTGNAIDGQGKGATIIGNRFRRCQGTPVGITNSYNVQVVGNLMEDWRRWISDGTTESAVARGHYAGGVVLRGARHCTVVANTMRYRRWAPVQTPGKQSYGVALIGYPSEDPEVGPVESLFNVVANNQISGTYGPIRATAAAGRNLIGPNNSAEVLEGSAIANFDNCRFDRMNFTPTLAGSGGDLEDGNYELRQGTIQFNHDEVTVCCWIEISAVFGLDGALSITSDDLPPAVGPVRRYVGTLSCQSVAHAAGCTEFKAEIDSGSSIIRLVEAGSGVKEDLTHGNVSAGSSFGVTISYRYA